MIYDIYLHTHVGNLMILLISKLLKIYPADINRNHISLKSSHKCINNRNDEIINFRKNFSPFKFFFIETLSIYVINFFF